MEPLDALTINFNADNLRWINVMLAIVMFSVALEIQWADFRQVIKRPLMVFTGVGSQFLVLPALTLLLISILPIAPSVALGMVLVAACPGGTVSNFFTLQANGNAALSVCLTTIATLSAGIMIPVGFWFWGGLSPITAPLLTEVSVDFLGILKLALWLLVLPLVLGMGLAHYVPKVAKKLSKPLRIASLLIFALLIVGAFVANFKLFVQLFHLVFWVVLLHNGLALFSGYGLGHVVGLKHREKRTIAIETGIQNSGIGLVIVFNFFPDLGGMAIIVAWWGIWHMVAGLTLAFLFNRWDKYQRIKMQA